MSLNILLVTLSLGALVVSLGSPTFDLRSCVTAMDGKLPSPTPPSFQFSGNVRRYYVAAEEVNWDYAPTGWDNWLGVPLEASPRAQRAGLLQHGTKWLKALYRGYNDSSFTNYSPQPPWQGTQGPTLRSEVGDLIEIMFLNKLQTYYATMHSMGLSYTKFYEGSDYPNSTTPGQNVSLPKTGAVPPTALNNKPGVGPGDCAVYKWIVDDSAGPPEGELAKVHSYHSFVALQEDTNAGLIGPQIVYARGKLASTTAQYREFPLLYMRYNESNSWLSGENRKRLEHPGPGESNSTRDNIGGDGTTVDIWNGNETIWQPQITNLNGAGRFSGAPIFNSMNGYIFSNNPMFEMCLNDKVIWYVNAFGSASHVFHMHGNGFAYHGVSEDAISINDGVGKTLYMNATGGGIWQVICHVADHQSAGMESNYRVYFSAQCALPTQLISS